MAERFYVNCPLAVGPVQIEGPEVHHLATVCRARAGDQVCLFNGDGHEYPAQVLEVRRQSVTLAVLGKESPRRELGFRLEVAAPLPKGDRAQFLIEKLTELGATRFIPLTTARSIVHPREAKLDKLRRWVIEASKQCGRNAFLDIGDLADWRNWSVRADLPPLRLLAHPAIRSPSLDSTPLLLSADFLPAADGLVVAVGPEGGFGEEEVIIACQAGWRLIDLGPRILRVETAAIALVAAITSLAATAP